MRVARAGLATPRSERALASSGRARPVEGLARGQGGKRTRAQGRQRDFGWRFSPSVRAGRLRVSASEACPRPRRKFRFQRQAEKLASVHLWAWALAPLPFATANANPMALPAPGFLFEKALSGNARLPLLQGSPGGKGRRRKQVHCSLFAASSRGLGSWAFLGAPLSFPCSSGKLRAVSLKASGACLKKGRIEAKA